MLVSNWFLTDQSAVIAGDFLGASTHVTSSAGTYINCIFNDAAGNQLEYYGLNGTVWAIPASSPLPAAGVAISTQDLAGDDGLRRVAATYALLGPDLVYQANGFGAGAWGAVVWGGGAPVKYWRAVGCDRNTAGGASARWLIGDSGSFGAIPPVVWTSTNGVNFSAVATFPVLAVGEQVRFIDHTCHPAGALGPDDVGNPSWLILTDNRCLVSADGATWSDQAHGFGVLPTDHKTAAYSRSSRRWVAVLGGASAGNVAYSDDNGATWTINVGVLPNVTGASYPSIVCDGYGTFVANDDGQDLWVSTDEGITWTQIMLDGYPGVTAGYDRTLLEVGVDASNNWNAPGAHPTFFTFMAHDTAAPLFEAFRSLIY
jgi:hypothetical protein